jgi:ABC-type uncharacterized transport system ATPase subunit
MSSPDHVLNNTLRAKLHAVQARIAAACTDSGRSANAVQLLAVSKTFSADDVRQVAACGQRDFGENYIQEGVDKIIALQDSLARQAGKLSHGQKQWLEIGMLLVQDPQLLLLDEPVAGMTDQETERTAELFLRLKGQHSLIVVEHDMAFIKAIAQTVTVLCDGAVLAQGPLAQVQADPRVIEVYLGR